MNPLFTFGEEFRFHDSSRFRKKAADTKFRFYHSFVPVLISLVAESCRGRAESVHLLKSYLQWGKHWKSSNFMTPDDSARNRKMRKMRKMMSLNCSICSMPVFGVGKDIEIGLRKGGSPSTQLELALTAEFVGFRTGGRLPFEWLYWILCCPLLAPLALLNSYQSFAQRFFFLWYGRCCLKLGPDRSRSGKIEKYTALWPCTSSNPRKAETTKNINKDQPPTTRKSPSQICVSSESRPTQNQQQERTNICCG